MSIALSLLDGLGEESPDTSGSLNAGAELEGEFLPVEAEEPPISITEEVNALVALESQLQDLFYVSEDIRRSHGMCQQFALEAQRLYPEFDGGAPLGFYTQAPSATRFKISLESLSKGVWVAITAAIVAVIALISKLTKWFSKGGSSGDAAQDSGDRAKQAAQNEDTLKQTVRRTDDLSADVANGDIQKTPEAAPPQRITMTTLIDDLWHDDHRYGRAKEFLATSNPVYHDILHTGPYTKAFRSLTPTLGVIRDALEQKLRIVEHVAKLDKESLLSSTSGQNTRELTQVGEPIRIGFQGGPMTLQEVADRLVAVRQHTVQQKTHAPMLLDQMVRAVSDAYHQSSTVKFFTEQRDILQVMGRMEKSLEQLQSSAGKLSTDGTAGQNTDGVAAHLREVIFKVGRDIAGYQSLFNELRQYGSYLDRLARETVGFAEEVEMGILIQARRKKLSIPDDWDRRVDRTRASKVEALFGQGGGK